VMEQLRDELFGALHELFRGSGWASNRDVVYVLEVRGNAAFAKRPSWHDRLYKPTLSSVGLPKLYGPVFVIPLGNKKVKKGELVLAEDYEIKPSRKDPISVYHYVKRWRPMPVGSPLYVAFLLYFYKLAPPFEISQRQFIEAFQLLGLAPKAERYLRLRAERWYSSALTGRPPLSPREGVRDGGR